MTDYQHIKRIVDNIRRKTSHEPRIAVVLGSGLGGFEESIRKVAEIPYADVGLPASTVSGHAGKLIFGYVGDVPIVAQSGRVHYYESEDFSSTDSAIFPRLFRMLGVQTLILTNAAGGVNESFEAGDLMLITDHIACFVPSPLKGKNIDELGTRFPDMTECYDVTLRTKALALSRELGIPLREGVYMQLPGPHYETPAEIRAYRILGADAVGMSTAVETITARHAGLKVIGVSCITNKAAGMGAKLSHEDVKMVAAKVSRDFSALIGRLIERI